MLRIANRAEVMAMIGGGWSVLDGGRADRPFPPVGEAPPSARWRLSNTRLRQIEKRCRLFLIIALGETVLTTGTAIAAAPMTRMTLVTGTVALAGTVALWELSFQRPQRLTQQHLEETCDPVRAGRYAVNGLIGMVAGLIAVAVANEMVVAHPHGDATAALSLLLYGGPMLYLVAQSWYLWAVTRVSPRLRLIGSAALVLLGLATLTAPPSVALMLVGATLWILAVLDRDGDTAGTDESI